MSKPPCSNIFVSILSFVAIKICFRAHSFFSIHFFHLLSEINKGCGNFYLGIFCIAFNKNIALIIRLSQCPQIRFKIISLTPGNERFSFSAISQYTKTSRASMMLCGDSDSRKHMKNISIQFKIGMIYCANYFCSRFECEQKIRFCCFQAFQHNHHFIFFCYYCQLTAQNNKIIRSFFLIIPIR